MKITKQQLKQIILKEFKVYTNAPPEASDDSEEQTKETLLDRLGTLLQEWPAESESWRDKATKVAGSKRAMLQSIEDARQDFSVKKIEGTPTAPAW